MARSNGDVAFEKRFEQRFQIGQIQPGFTSSQEPFGRALDPFLASRFDPVDPSLGQGVVERGIEREGEWRSVHGGSSIDARETGS